MRLGITSSDVAADEELTLLAPLHFQSGGVSDVAGNPSQLAVDLVQNPSKVFVLAHAQGSENTLELRVVLGKRGRPHSPIVPRSPGRQLFVLRTAGRIPHKTAAALPGPEIKCGFRRSARAPLPRR